MNGVFTAEAEPEITSPAVGLLGKMVGLVGDSLSVSDCVDVFPLRSEGSKEVFLAIQVDGVTRARTALLTLRGSALSLNHAFHLELERARQLRVVVLTPGNLVLLMLVILQLDL